MSDDTVTREYRRHLLDTLLESWQHFGMGTTGEVLLPHEQHLHVWPHAHMIYVAMLRFLTRRLPDVTLRHGITFATLDGEEQTTKLYTFLSRNNRKLISLWSLPDDYTPVDG